MLNLDRALTEGDNNEGNPSDVLHLPVELEVALPPDNLVAPLYHSAKKAYDAGYLLRRYIR